MWGEAYDLGGEPQASDQALFVLCLYVYLYVFVFEGA